MLFQNVPAGGDKEVVKKFTYPEKKEEEKKKTKKKKKTEVVNRDVWKRETCENQKLQFKQ